MSLRIEEYIAQIHSVLQEIYDEHKSDIGFLEVEHANDVEELEEKIEELEAKIQSLDERIEELEDELMRTS
jgi:predicted ribosome quality control (RQC) complex YloA/Tae2 family protein